MKPHALNSTAFFGRIPGLRPDFLASGPLYSDRRFSSKFRRPVKDQAFGALMFTIQLIPNWSVHIPNVSPQTSFFSGMLTFPPVESFLK